MCSVKKDKPVLILTRPLSESQRLARILEQNGYQCFINPLLSIKPVESQSKLPEAHNTAGLIVTSANAIRFFPGNVKDFQNVPVYAIGEKTASIAKNKGFYNVMSAKGDSESLVDLCRKEISPDTGVLVWLRGKHTHIDIVQKLIDFNFSIVPKIVYDSKKVAFFEERTLLSIKTGTPHAFLLFSRRTAESCAEAIEQSGLSEKLDNVRMFCISEDTKTPIEHFNVADVQVSDTPQEEALLSLLV